MNIFVWDHESLNKLHFYFLFVKAFRNVWKRACTSSSPKRIVLSAGKTYLVGPIDFGGPCISKVTLRVSARFILLDRCL